MYAAWLLLIGLHVDAGEPPPAPAPPWRDGMYWPLHTPVSWHQPRDDTADDRCHFLCAFLATVAPNPIQACPPLFQPIAASPGTSLLETGHWPRFFEWDTKPSLVDPWQIDCLGSSCLTDPTPDIWDDAAELPDRVEWHRNYSQHNPTMRVIRMANFMLELMEPGIFPVIAVGDGVRLKVPSGVIPMRNRSFTITGLGIEF